LSLAARVLGVAAVAARVEPIMFSKTFRADRSREAERAFWRRQLTANRRTIYRAVNGVIERRGVYDELSRVTVPTLVAVGDEDVATVPSRAERIHGAIRGSRLVRIPGAGHSSAVEQPARVNAAIDEFLASLPQP
ncbi:MAG: alpha/beta fold hydrolase, partial [Deltaproteobacteria bacterium]